MRHLQLVGEGKALQSDSDDSVAVWLLEAPGGDIAPCIVGMPTKTMSRTLNGCIVIGIQTQEVRMRSTRTVGTRETSILPRPCRGEKPKLLSMRPVCTV